MAKGRSRCRRHLLEDVFALNEELDTVREMRAAGAPAEQWMPRLEAARLPIEQRRAAHERELQNAVRRSGTRWSSSGAGEPERRPVLAALRERMLERNYINNLLAGIERELAQ